MVLLLCNAIIVSRDYRDTWILEGVEVTFAALMITYLAYFMVEKKFTWLLFFAIIVRFTILLVPSLKYPWYYGSALDQHRAYRFTQDIFDQGVIGDVYAGTYAGTPLMHLSFAIYSMMTGLNVVTSFKLYPLIPWTLFPVFTYLVINQIVPKNDRVKKYALLVASIPLKSALSFVVIGTLFAPLMIYIILYVLTQTYRLKYRRNIVLLILFSLSLAGTHTFSAITFSLLLGVLYFLWYFFKHFGFKKLMPVGVPSALFLIVIFISVTWYSFYSTARDMSLNALLSFMGSALGLIENPWEGGGLGGGFIVARFFEIGFLSQIQVIIVSHAVDVVLIVTTMIGFWVVISRTRKDRMERTPELSLQFLYVVTLFLFLVFGLVMSIGFNWYDRILRLFLVSAPIFTAIGLQYSRARTRQVLPLLVIGLFLVATTIQVYRCQPLIPPASSYDTELPDDEPLTDRHGVNTIYQREMITFAAQNLPSGTRFASDAATSRMIIGLTDRTFRRGYVYWYPLSGEEPRNPRARDYDVFLIHLPGKSGALIDSAETRTTTLILSTITHSNIIYTNGESYILGPP
jgi:hypothetical protein